MAAYSGGGVGYVAIGDACRVIGAELGVPASEVQAAYWTYIRDLYNRTPKGKRGRILRDF